LAQIIGVYFGTSGNQEFSTSGVISTEDQKIMTVLIKIFWA